MSSTRASPATSTDEILTRLLLDIKALMLLSNSDQSLVSQVEEKIASSHDEQIASFVSMLSSKKKPESGRSFLFIALGEMVFAALLSVLGLALLAPSVAGLSSSTQLLSYFSEIVTAMSPNSFSNPILPIGAFILAVLLLIGAFYNLR
ncbi:MAG: hypothetical protein OK439_00835, partial [Thaumarchaeota archaeon]|nr:hypothetical protein [Nitrososphaerota archaeon]